jgi:hypothetical protein
MDHAANAGAGPQRPKTDSTQSLADHYWLVTPDKAVVLASSTWEPGSVGVVGNRARELHATGAVVHGYSWVGCTEYAELDYGWRGRGLLMGK